MIRAWQALAWIIGRTGIVTAWIHRRVEALNRGVWRRYSWAVAGKVRHQVAARRRQEVAADG